MQNLTKKEKSKLTWILKNQLDVYSDYKKFYKEELQIVKSILNKLTN